MSGALGRGVGTAERSSVNKENSAGLPLDGNWVLSRSVPNSLNNGHNNLQRWTSTSSPSSPEQVKTLFSFSCSIENVIFYSSLHQA